MASPNLGIAHLSATQRFKETSMNQAIDQLDSASNGRLVVPFTSNIVATTGAGVARTGGVVTVNTQAAHQLAAGMPITIAGVADNSYNGNFNVLAVVSQTSFTYTQAGTNSTSQGGTVQVTGDWTLNTTATPGALFPQATGYFFYDIQGALTANRNLIVPTSTKQYVVRNATTGAFTLTVKTASGTGIAVPQGHLQKLFCDGTNVVATAASV